MFYILTHLHHHLDRICLSRLLGDDLHQGLSLLAAGDQLGLESLKLSL
jgi:hypothetical protein